MSVPWVVCRTGDTPQPCLGHPANSNPHGRAVLSANTSPGAVAARDHLRDASPIRRRLRGHFGAWYRPSGAVPARRAVVARPRPFQNVRM